MGEKYSSNLKPCPKLAHGPGFHIVLRRSSNTKARENYLGGTFLGHQPTYLAGGGEGGGGGGGGGLLIKS